MMTNGVLPEYSPNANAAKDVKDRKSVEETPSSAKSTNTTTSQVDIQDEDARLLARIGYKQVSLSRLCLRSIK